MQRRRRLGLGAAALTLAATTSASTAGLPPRAIFVSVNEWGMYVPGDFRFPELQLELPQGSQLQFANMDVVIGAHSLTDYQPDSFEAPRFDSGVLNPGEVAEVTGVDQLPVGDYDFFCSTHGSVMRGVLHIVRLLPNKAEPHRTTRLR